MGRGGVVPRQSHKLQAPVQFGAAQQLLFKNVVCLYNKMCRWLFVYWYTNDLEKRFEKHKSGKGAKYTRSHNPKKIVFFEKYDNKIVAHEKRKRN